MTRASGDASTATTKSAARKIGRTGTRHWRELLQSQAGESADLLNRIGASLVTGDEHWWWAAGCDGKGRPAISVDGRKVGIRRILWCASGRPLPDHWVVRRCCGERLCVRPEHMDIRSASQVGAWVDPLERLHPLEEIEECLVWKHVTRRVPEMSVKGRRVTLARMVWELHLGAVPDGAVVVRVCNQVSCVRIEHLRLAATASLANDVLASAGRGNRGENHSRSKLTWADVDKIRNDRGSSLSQLASRFGVSKSTISKIRRNLCWRVRPDSVVS